MAGKKPPVAQLRALLDQVYALFEPGVKATIVIRPGDGVQALIIGNDSDPFNAELSVATWRFEQIDQLIKFNVPAKPARARRRR
jgi:hypothetical protein